MTLTKEEKDAIDNIIRDKELKELHAEELRKYEEKQQSKIRKKIRSKGFFRDVLEEVFKK